MYSGEREQINLVVQLAHHNTIFLVLSHTIMFVVAYEWSISQSLFSVLQLAGIMLLLCVCVVGSSCSHSAFTCTYRVRWTFTEFGHHNCTKCTIITWSVLFITSELHNHGRCCSLLQDYIIILCSSEVMNSADHVILCSSEVMNSADHVILCSSEVMNSTDHVITGAFGVFGAVMGGQIL